MNILVFVVWILFIIYVKAKGATIEPVDVYQQVYRTKDGAAITTGAQENMVSTIWSNLILVYFVFVLIMVCNMLFDSCGKTR